MKYSFNLLKQILPQLNVADISTLQDKLSSQLAEIEDVEHISNKLEGLLVAQVKEVKKHPNSNKLYIVQVDIGDKIVQVVAGAGNIKPGNFVPYTPVNVRVPRNAYPERFDGIVRKIKLAGEISEGMLNSEFELGISESHEQILILDELTDYGISLKAGQPLYKVLGFDDYLIEIENKAMTHRGDVFSHIGLAQEIAAILQIDFDYDKALQKVFDLYFPKLVQHKFKKSSSGTINNGLQNIKIGYVDKDVWQYNLYYLSLDNSIDTPLLIKSHLSKFGIGVVNYIVDLVNFITIVLGQPMHAFDLQKLHKQFGDNLIVEVKYVEQGKFLGLDKKEYDIKKSTLCITVNDTPVAFAGVSGGLDTAVDRNTKEVLLEIATFSYAPIRRTMMLYGLNTYASVVYARQQSPVKVGEAAEVLKHIFAGIQEIAKVVNTRIQTKTLTIDLDFIHNFIGYEFPTQLIQRSLANLGLENEVINKQLKVVVPPYRLDINIKQDIIEEIVRIIGYDKLQPKLPQSAPVIVNTDNKITLRTRLGERLIANNYFEVVGYGFFSNEIIKAYDFNVEAHYKIINAISPEVSFYRSSIYPQLVSRIDKNLQYTNTVKFYEIGHIAHKKLEESFDDIYKYHQGFFPKEGFHLAGIIASKAQKLRELMSQLTNNVLALGLDLRIMPLLDIKDTKNGIPNYWKEMLKPFNKWASGVLIWQDQIVGIVGTLQSKIQTNVSNVKNIVLFELDLVPFLANQTIYTVHDAINNPAIYEDYSVVVPNTKSFYFVQQVLENCIQKLQKEMDNVYINSELLDIYYPDNAQFRYVTFRLFFTSPKDKVLSDVVKEFRQKFIACLDKSDIKLKD